MAMKKTDSGNNSQLMRNSLDNAKTTNPINAVEDLQCEIQGNEIMPFYLPLSECGVTYASDNSSIPIYLSFDAIENNLHIDQFKFINSDIEPIIESEGDIKHQSETSKTLCDNTSTVKTVSTKNIDIDEYKSSPANCEIKLSIVSDYDEKCKTETLFKAISENKQNICKYVTLGFLLSVVCCVIYYFASESLKLVVESTPALTTSNQIKYLHRKSATSSLSVSREHNTMTKNIVAIPNITKNKNEKREYSRIPSDTMNASTKLIYYFASKSFELVEESTTALKTSYQFKYLNRKSVITYNVTENNNDQVQYSSIPSNTFNSSTKLTPSAKVTMPISPSTFKVRHRLYVTNGDKGGRWNSDIYCQPGTYVCGFRLKVEKDKGTFQDDAGLTNVLLYCKNSELSTKSFVASSVSDYNTNSYWRADIFCTENYYLVAFQLRVDPRIWYKSEQVAITNINFVCRGPGLNGLQSYNILGNGMMHWGNWGTFSEYCEIGTAICGMQTKAQAVPVWDKLGMTDLKLLCCQNL